MVILNAAEYILEYDDEGHHFERGLLKEDCRVRENRIKKLLNCCFLRASFINNK